MTYSEIEEPDVPLTASIIPEDSNITIINQWDDVNNKPITVDELLSHNNTIIMNELISDETILNVNKSLRKDKPKILLKENKSDKCSYEEFNAAEALLGIKFGIEKAAKIAKYYKEILEENEVYKKYEFSLDYYKGNQEENFKQNKQNIDRIQAAHTLLSINLGKSESTKLIKEYLKDENIEIVKTPVYYPSTHNYLSKPRIPFSL